MEHFLATGYFSDKQYGFIKGRSTVLQLLKILDDWTYNYDLGNQIDVPTLRKPLIKFLIKD